MDILPTVSGLTGAALPVRPLDGVDIWPLLTGVQTEVRREAFLYFNDDYLQCARLGQWKLHLARFNVPMFTPVPARGRVNLPLPRPELYDMVNDPEESYDRADRNPLIVASIRAQVDRLITTFPQSIIDTYRDTMSRKVHGTPVGALPEEQAN
jgi:arylsulfatase A-like enzyme